MPGRGPRGDSSRGLANLTNGRYLRMLTEVKKFHREARAVLAREATDADRDETLGSFAERCGFSAYFTRHFLEPVVAAVWSCDPARLAALPGPLPVRVPRPPRHADGVRVARPGAP